MPTSPCACTATCTRSSLPLPQLDALYRDARAAGAGVLQRMERTGVLIDPFLLAQHSEELGRRLHARSEAHELAGQPFNLGSPKQLGEILFTKLGLPVVKKTATGQPSTDEDVLEKLAEDYPLPKLLLEHRSLSKLKNTYTDKLPRMVNPHTGRVHTSFSPGHRGHRPAVELRAQPAEHPDPHARRPPHPRRLHRPARPQDRLGRLLADRAAHHGPPVGRRRACSKAFARGEDVHRATAGEVFGVAPAEVTSEQRRYAKVINFGLIYGMSAHGLAKNLGIERAAAQAYIDRYFARYPGVAATWSAPAPRRASKGYVETVFGRRLHLPDIRASQAGRRQGAERAAINAPMQGTAADLIKKAMIATDAWLASWPGLEVEAGAAGARRAGAGGARGELDRCASELPRLMGGVAN
jgi:DNA polymerase-1